MLRKILIEMADIYKLNRMMSYMTQILFDTFRALQTLHQRRDKYMKLRQGMIKGTFNERLRLV